MKSLYAQREGWIYGSEIEHKELKKYVKELLHECETGQAKAMYLATEDAQTREGNDGPLIETGEQAITIVFNRIKGPWEYLNGQQKLEEAE